MNMTAPPPKQIPTMKLDSPKRSVRFSDQLEAVCTIESYGDLPLWWKTDDLTGQDAPTTEGENENADPTDFFNDFELYLAAHDGAYKQLKVQGVVGLKTQRRLGVFLAESDFRALEHLSSYGKIRGHVQSAERLAIVDMSQTLQYLKEKDTESATTDDTWETLAKFSRARSNICQLWAHVMAKLDAKAASSTTEYKAIGPVTSPVNESSVLSPRNTDSLVPVEKPATKLFRIVQRHHVRPMLAL